MSDFLLRNMLMSAFLLSYFLTIHLTTHNNSPTKSLLNDNKEIL
jgi:hypothetical protein